MEPADSYFFALAFAFAPSSAYSAGTIAKATVSVAIHRTANLIVAPSNRACLRCVAKAPRIASSPYRFVATYFIFHGAGTLITVFTMVTDALSANALPLSVVMAILPAVENVTPEEAMMVPTMVPPPAPLIVAMLPTCQNTFLACAPLTRMPLRGAPGAPTVSELAIWNTQRAFTPPCASKVRSDPVIMNEPAAALYKPGART